MPTNKKGSTEYNVEGFEPKAVTVKVAGGQKIHLDIQLQK